LILINLVLTSLGLSFALERVLTSESCPDGWIYAQDSSCFKFLPEALDVNWMDAHYLCEVEGGFLAEPTSEELMEVLKLLAYVEEDFTGISYWWIGLADFSHEGSWVWAHTGQRVGQTFWRPGSPHTDTHNREDCVLVELKDYSLNWVDVDCEMKSYYNQSGLAPLCQMKSGITTTSNLPATTTTNWPRTTTTTNWPRTSTTTYWPRTTTTTYWPRTTTTTDWPRTSTTTYWPRTTTTTLSPPPTCPLGWSHFEGKCFQAVVEKLDWISARAFCKSEGGELASIHSSQENSFVKDLVRAVGIEDLFWLGGTDSESETVWQWSDGTPWDYQDHYFTSSGGEAKNCLIIDYTHGTSRLGSWGDISCFRKTYFVCSV